MTDGGNVKVMTVMGEALVDGLSDAGSTPARSTKRSLLELFTIKKFGSFDVSSEYIGFGESET